MGNSGSGTKSSAGNEREKRLESVFKQISNGKSSAQSADLKKHWSPQIDNHLYNLLEKSLTVNNPGLLNRRDFVSLYLNLCSNGLDDKVTTLTGIINEGDANSDVISSYKLFGFIISVLSTIIKLCSSLDVKTHKDWSSKGLALDENNKKLYADYLTRNLTKKETYAAEDVRVLLQDIDVFINIILNVLYDGGTKEVLSNIYPKCVLSGFDHSVQQLSVLDAVSIMFLNNELPIDFQSEWRLLFTTNVHGESFSKLTGQIINRGASILIVRDKDGHVFGGFAPDSWRHGPIFFGNSSSFLFTLKPKFNIYSTSNFNDHYQYMNIGQQTIPNGLGMGGQFNYFGLYLDSEFGKGISSESCTTYRNYKMLSKNKEFEISHLEVWAVGPPPPSSEELGERSVLDSNVEAKAMLEMIGKKQYSEGLREEKE